MSPTNKGKQMKKHLLSAALVCAFAAGSVTMSFAQATTSGGAAGAGSVSGSNPDATGPKPANSGTTAGSAGAGTSGRIGVSGPGLGKIGGDTSEDRVPHN
jgi:hypothetical protein